MRYLLAIGVFCFGLLIVSISIWRARPPLLTLAADSAISEPEAMSADTPSETMTGDADFYPLPYPGLLPDHPLYFLKMIRDRIRLWLTRDALARAGLMLHYADKRMAASLVLAEKGKVGLAASTATKAQMYVERALGEAEIGERAGKDTSGFWEKVRLASRKHEQVLAGVRSRTPEEAASSLEQATETHTRIRERSGEANVD